MSRRVTERVAAWWAAEGRPVGPVHVGRVGEVWRGES